MVMLSSELLEQRSRLLQERLEDVFELGKQRLSLKGVSVDGIHTLRQLMMAIDSVPQTLLSSTEQLKLHDWLDQLLWDAVKITKESMTSTNITAPESRMETLWDSAFLQGDSRQQEDRLHGSFYDGVRIETSPMTSTNVIAPESRMETLWDSAFFQGDSRQLEERLHSLYDGAEILIETPSL